jgi:3-keto-disaccharide hydrolase
MSRDLLKSRFLMKVKLARFGLLLAVISAAQVAPAQERPWIPLFDGQTLNGWHSIGGAAKFEVKDGTLVGTSVPNTPHTFLCADRTFGDFILEYEFLVDPELNSGVQIRSHSDPAYQKGKLFGYQVEIDGDTRTKRFWSAGIFDQTRRGWLNDLSHNEAARKAFKPGEWNKTRVEAMGDSIKTWINGVAAADLVDSADLEGLLCLQMHSVGKREQPMHVAFRNIRIQDHGVRAWLPVFNSKDLTGFHATSGKWAVEGGSIDSSVIRGDARPSLLVADKPSGDFTIRAEYRVTGNADFYFRANLIEGSPNAESLGIRLDSPEAAGGLYQPDGTVIAAAAGVRKAFKPGDWNQLTVSARGGRIVVHVNGIRTVSVDEHPGPGEGVFAFRLSGGQDARLEVRHFEMLSGASRQP